ncbi:hypothetical protein GYMLUDRAFT_665287 [Collybiopsis luxurians FD-317 M1]|uniref:Uncharacterized protein n=1 Tax=Collybiopsis luxurians FD-317 M1 TaxID=944289 RepID=A0A0D0BWC3_9AGAR|nr:hypothetical protein GYMLUDRAFT_665287 [Collybiopsis luxurians FD-317 M1]
MKGSWSYFPDERYVSWVREQLSSFSVLSNKMYAISCAAFKSFSLFMQTGAFIQLILTLIAITSRLAMLAAEMNEILQLAIPAIDRLFAVFKPSADTEENKEAIFEPTPITTATSGSMPKVEFREASPPPRSGKPSEFLVPYFTINLSSL